MKHLVFMACESAVVMSFVVFVVSQRPKYRSDYRYEKAFNSFYKLHSAGASWAEARMRCEGENATLLVPESLDEADAIQLLMASILNKFKGIFVGIHDFYSERYFVSVQGKPVQNSILNLLWEKQEPKYRAGHCIGMRRSGRLFVHQCDDPLPYICKTKASGLIYKPECDTFDPRWKVGHNDDCYIVHEEPQNWYQAYATCLAAGGQLLVIRNRTEATYVRDLFKQVQERRTPDNNFAFIGYSDLFQRHHFRTIHGKSIDQSGYSDWDFMCPPNDTATKPLRCGGIRRSGLLFAGDCDIPAMFFCKKTRKKKENLRQSDILQETVTVDDKNQTTPEDEYLAFQ